MTQDTSDFLTRGKDKHSITQQQPERPYVIGDDGVVTQVQSVNRELLEALKKEGYKINPYDSDYLCGLAKGNIDGWNACIDHLAAKGYLRAPVERIDSLKEALEFFDKNPTIHPNINGYFNVLLETTRAYLKLQGGE